MVLENANHGNNSRIGTIGEVQIHAHACKEYAFKHHVALLGNCQLFTKEPFGKSKNACACLQRVRSILGQPKLLCIPIAGPHGLPEMTY